MRIPPYALLLLMTAAIQAEAALREVPVSGPPRAEPVRQVVIHATGGPDCDPARRFRGGTLDGIVAHFLRHQGTISIHYVIGRDGSVVSMVPESRVAHHVRGRNADSIGIELVNDGDGRDPFPDAQIAALASVLRGILDRHGLRFSSVKSHAELDDSSLTCEGQRIKRKQDPGAAFPWSPLQRAVESRALAVPTVRKEERATAPDEAASQRNRRQEELRARLRQNARDQDDARTALRLSRQQRARDPEAAALAMRQGDDQIGSMEEAISQLEQREKELRAELKAVGQTRERAAVDDSR
ncbi:hypothetical protein CCR95_01805 [Thiocystis minor]|uniref:N-acetylmuramoyl-L-alanine amidase n=1 Tax=Thiocystis minor TaxID=61597 RepID=UPI001F5E169C|nr:peptidoglycan recognition family protein [Thiocystis minor]MBK5962857.1 hypothetical protein [Thiocystis minor]